MKNIKISLFSHTSIFTLLKMLLLISIGILIMLFSWAAGVAGELPEQLFALALLIIPLGMISRILIIRIGLPLGVSFCAILVPLLLQFLFVCFIIYENSNVHITELVLSLGALVLSVIGLALGKNLRKKIIKIKTRAS